MSEQGKIYCSKCGCPNLSTSSFCTQCGSKLVLPETSVSNSGPSSPTPSSSTYQTSQRPPQPTYQPYTPRSVLLDPEVVQLIGDENTGYYQTKFQEMKSQEKKISWNGAAFFFGPIWFIYRKMYVYGYALLALQVLINIMVGPSIIIPLYYAGMGILGNYVYMNYLEKLADNARAVPNTRDFIATNRGVNTVATVVVLIVEALWIIYLMRDMI